MGEKDPILEERLSPLPSVPTFSVTSCLNLSLAATSDEYVAASDHNDVEELGKQLTLLRYAARIGGGEIRLRQMRQKSKMAV